MDAIDNLETFLRPNRDRSRNIQQKRTRSTTQMMNDKASSTYFEGALLPVIDQHGDNPVVIRLTNDERDSGVTRPETIQQCLYHYHRDGFVVLENAIDDALVDSLYEKIVEDTGIYVGKKFQQWNQGEATKNVSVVPPLTPEWLRREFYANVHMMRVIENVLGPKPELRFINSNVAIPGATSRQAVHSDVNHKYPAIPFGIVVNTYLQDSDEKNGVTEVNTCILRCPRSMLMNSACRSGPAHTTHTRKTTNRPPRRAAGSTKSTFRSRPK
jgi:hypothetical protein